MIMKKPAWLLLSALIILLSCHKDKVEEQEQAYLIRLYRNNVVLIINATT